MTRKLISMIMLGSFLLLMSGCEKPSAEKSSEQAATPPAAQVTAIKVYEQQTPSHNDATGTIEAVQRTTIAAKVTGTIEKLPVEIGSEVEKGKLLIKISAGEISARVSQAEAQLQQARRNLDREKRLLEKEASTHETVKSMEDRFRVAEAAHREAKTMYGYTTINAPFSGVISSKNVQAGDLATPGTPLLILEDTRELQVVASVPEALAFQLKLGNRLSVRVGDGVTRSCVVSEISPSIDPMSRTIMVKLKIEDISGLRPGQYVRLVLPGTAVSTITVPAMAVSRYGQMERLFVAENGIARLRLVRTGAVSNGNIAILSGITAGELIIVHGNDQLVDGQPVEIMP